MEKEFVIKRDKYFRKRGSYCRILKVKCSKCGRVLFEYQKDGPGWLKRCYVNRIISNKKFSGNQELRCCRVIGTPITHKDGRKAYKLIRGNFLRTYPPKLT